MKSFSLFITKINNILSQNLDLNLGSEVLYSYCFPFFDICPTLQQYFYSLDISADWIISKCLFICVFCHKCLCFSYLHISSSFDILKYYITGKKKIKQNCPYIKTDWSWTDQSEASSGCTISCAPGKFEKWSVLSKVKAVACYCFLNLHY